MKFTVLIIACLTVLSLKSYAQKGTLNWVQESKEAAWQARDSQGEFVFKGQMWILGGWFTPQLPNPRDVWKSPDGKNWTRVIETAPWQHSDLSAAVVFKDRMWMMGGRKLPGNIGAARRSATCLRELTRGTHVPRSPMHYVSST